MTTFLKTNKRGLMHLKNSTSKKARAEEADSVILETASTQDTIENTFEGLDDFFTSLNPENIDSPTSVICDLNTKSPQLTDGSLIIKSLQENVCVFRKDLNHCVYLRCELYKGFFKIHIRKFLISESSVKPTLNGVAMDLHSWFDFFQKVFNFNLLYSSSSFVANNNILVTNTNSQMIVKNLQTNAWIALDDDQLNNLKLGAHDLNEELIDYLYSNYLPKVIQMNYSPNCVKIDDELSLMKSLIISIEESVASVFPKIFECNGCIINHGSQLQHPCITFTNFEKFCNVSDLILILVNIHDIVKDFLRREKCISKRFLENIDVKFIRNILFETVQ
ncbi:hypothetical protein NPIL_458281 [Nephila pilipes]|uniref:Uncharacterized protein n=1 Tax=Nephila pilipes TaxID=299642 RepID=A0A8X6PVN9_NEPPI|nr:hypothetical protein NPIL_644501 [Nephila pilipes]GFU07156.1 hypothetical protein NPIL_458281 [Nephila pilipes]